MQNSKLVELLKSLSKRKLSRFHDFIRSPYFNKNTDIGLGPGKGGWVRRVVGGKFGLIVDARGRPLQIPNDEDARISRLKDWQDSLSEMRA